jgi:coiled-coil and C2 domain-containing protein 2A
VKIYLNDKLVYTTNEAQLQSDFSAQWGQIFNIYMISYPDSIILQIFEHIDSRSRERLIAEIILPTPELNCTSANYNLEDYEFSSREAFYMHLKTSNQIELFYTSGSIKAGSSWGIDEKDGSVLAPPKSSSELDSALKHEEMKNFDPIVALGVSHMQDMEKLAKWILKSNLDPNDPRNADLINLIKVNLLPFTYVVKLLYFDSKVVYH